MIAIIDYGAGNTKSLQFALERLGVKSILTSDPEQIKSAEKVIFPGQGAAGSAMKKLQHYGLDKVIRNLTQPVLGICLGMQLLCEHSEEGNIQGLGIVQGTVRRFSDKVKVPQMGWNSIHKLKGSLFEGISEASYMYLVHSYYVPEIKETVATADYNGTYSVALQKDNFYGVQFHPEKSSLKGQLLLNNFLNISL
ncbi:imidazole glycerol phosphate synthase subunit HisH [Flavobacteriaceae bacterium]|jgi:glutamine amidotransferase|nr:imidazole glycerol phosphate synthase subunit HisH [Flavobacteriaceae bacterium]MDA9003304.1 imidazole glycerol phosphate synthase subunit HisH [Flavobacteriaceae bacterium]MDA9843796.1 imidazole glycerol phosphate synthase subunit HisH [Flavobacteriaceae bacterium]MDA9879354.1 imidazole glycerol phosphate synthase subunit HisH [Flavobacteriaceae bacterium]